MPAGDAAEVDYRVSDAERERVVARLRACHAEGRLTFEEFEERVTEAYQARSVSALNHALRELPSAPGPDAAVRRGRRRWRLGGWWLRVNGICIAIWAATSIGGIYYFWPMWVLIGTSIPLIAAGRSSRHSGARKGTGSRVVDLPAESIEEESKRVVATVMFADIVGSTERAAAVGDAAWNTLLDSYQRTVLGDLAACGGHEVFTKGDEVVAAFPTPAGAVQCGRAIRDHARELDLEVRIGVHAGEVEQQGRAMRGLAMHIGQRVCACALPGELLVSSTVRDLLAGSGLEFREAGDYELKGLTGAWRLYSIGD
ncbi:MAG TPA: DUF1707 domain-containing protein [Mycobacteriales bacterium]|nr:DUF1707 domain-containing protein [Mycobacteriales bacterium]